MNASIVNKIKEKYLDADYNGVIESFEESPDGLKSDEIVNDDDAEISALVSFSYFNIDDFDNALLYAGRLINHMILNRQYDVGRDLFENSVMIVIDSLLFKRREIKAYFLIKKIIAYIDKDGKVGREVMERFDRIRNNMAERLGNAIRYLVLISGVILVGGQMYFHFLSPGGNLLLSGILVFLVLFGLKWNHILIRTIRKAL